jgi:hypothetical protein
VTRPLHRKPYGGRRPGPEPELWHGMAVATLASLVVLVVLVVLIVLVL